MSFASFDKFHQFWKVSEVSKVSEFEGFGETSFAKFWNRPLAKLIGFAHNISYNDEDKLLNKFKEFTMRDENDFCEFLKRVDARELKYIDDNNEVPKVILTFEGIQPNQLYCISAVYFMAIKKDVTWSKVKDMVVEIEIILALKNKLKKIFKSPVEVFTN